MEAKKVLFISQEVSPYVPDTPMSLLGRNIPQGVHGKEFEVRIFTPKYGCINERRNQLHEVIRLSGLNLVIDDNDHPHHQGRDPAPLEDAGLLHRQRRLLQAPSRERS